MTAIPDSIAVPIDTVTSQLCIEPVQNGLITVNSVQGRDDIEQYALVRLWCEQNESCIDIPDTKPGVCAKQKNYGR